MRYYKRARPSLRAWGFALAVPAIALFALFSLLPYEAMVANWPLGIRQDEVMRFQRWFDQRPGQHASVDVEEVSLTSDGRWHAKDQESPIASQDDRGASDGVVVVFPADAPFHGQHGLELRPADLSSLRTKYAQMVAESLGLPAPSVALVRLMKDGDDRGLHVRSETVSPEYVLRTRSDAAVLLKRGSGANVFEPYAPGLDGSPIDPSKFVLRSPAQDDGTWGALALVLYAEERKDLPGGDGGLVYDHGQGRVVPLYRTHPLAAEADSASPLEDFAAKRIRSKASYAAMREHAARLRADSATWVERFIAMEAQWEPVLADGRSLGLVNATTKGQRDRFLRRLFDPMPEAFFGPAEEGAVGTPARAMAVPAWMERHRSQPDTIRLVRGKYEVDEDIDLPEGMALVLEKGARLFIAPGKNLVVNGPLHMRGTALNPVFIRPQVDGTTYGAILVRGTGTTACTLRGVRMSGGTATWVDGAFAGGALSFHGCSPVLTDCMLEGPGGEAVVEVRRGSLVMKDCRLAGPAHYLVRGIAAKVELRRCHLSMGGPSGGTDAGGVWVQGGQLLVSDAVVEALPGSGVRAGRAAQVLVLGTTFTSCGMGVLAEDGSVVHVDKSTFKEVRQALVARARVPILGGGHLVTHRNEGLGTPQDRVSDASSTITSSAVPDPAFWGLFNVQP